MTQDKLNFKITNICNRKKNMNSNLKSIICDTCGTEKPRHKAFFMYDKKTCSSRCMEPYRIAKQIEEKSIEEARESKRVKNGAFSMSGGGAF